jgi:hypothetical protein
MNLRLNLFALSCVVGLSTPLHAWGPHSEITQAAMDALPADCALRKQLGARFAKLRDYCWMADWRRQLHREPDHWFFTDDYLLFPAFPKHSDHLCPEVKQTYDPYFRRALQALRTETPLNAARWIGSILHFTEDTGSPPHAGEIRGDVHSKMENWVDAKAIHIPGYHPQLLGGTEEEAVQGFLKRMNGLIEFSKERAERAKPLVLAGDRPSTEPIVLESALEVSRVVADLLFTLGELNARLPDNGAVLRGTVKSATAPGLEKVGAKVMISGTLFSTLADADGHYEFHHLPSGTLKMDVLRAGNASLTASADIPDRGEVRKDLEMTPDSAAGNLARNSAFKTTWLGKDHPDDWYPTRPKLGGPCWEGEFVPLTDGVHYRLQVSWKTGVSGTVAVKLGKGVNQPVVEMPSLEAGQKELEFTGTPETTYAQVQIHCAGQPSELCSHVSIVPFSENVPAAGK